MVCLLDCFSIHFFSLATGDVVVFLDAHCEANAGW